MNRMIINSVDPASGVQIGLYAMEQIWFLTNSFLGQISAYLYVNGILQTVSFSSGKQIDLPIEEQVTLLMQKKRKPSIFGRIRVWGRKVLSKFSKKEN